MRRVSFKIICLFCLLLSVLCFMTGCSDREYDGDTVVSVSFSDSVSRFLVPEKVSLYRPEELFWTYTAEKTGQVNCFGETRNSAGSLVEMPVSAGDTRGLAGYPKRFSTGYWTFKVYGYLDKGHTASKLVYSGVREKVNVEANADGTAKTPVIGFELTNENVATYHTRGKLMFGSVFVTVPEGMSFVSGKTIKVTVKEGTTEVATGTTTLSATYSAESPVVLEPFTVSVSDFTSGQHTLTYEAVYSGTGVKFLSGSYVVDFAGGLVTVLSGNLDDTGRVVATTGTAASMKAYTSLKDAVEANEGDVTLWQNVDYAGTLNLPATNVNVNSGNFHVNGTVLGSSVGSKTITFVPGSGRSYKFSGAGKGINFKANGNDVLIYTTGGADGKGGGMTVNAPNDNVIHEGIINTLTVVSAKKDIANVKGYYFNGDVKTSLTVNAGLLNFGPDADIKELIVKSTSSGSVDLLGTTTTVIQNMAKLRDNDIGDADIAPLDANSKTAFRKVELKGTSGWFLGYNGATGKATKHAGESRYIYGIEGMYMDLPLMIDSTRGNTMREMIIFYFYERAFTYWTYTDDASKVVTDAKKKAFIMPDSSITISLTANWLDWYLCFTAEQANSKIKTILTHQTGSGTEFLEIKSYLLELEYSTDFGVTWADFLPNTVTSNTAWTPSAEVVLAEVGDKVFFRTKRDKTYGPCSNMSGVHGSNAFSIEGRMTGSGSVDACMQTVRPASAITGGSYYCAGVFMNCSGLTYAPDCAFYGSPSYCAYYKLFVGCTGLRGADISSQGVGTSFGNWFYGEAFDGCTNLVFLQVCIDSWPVGPSSGTAAMQGWVRDCGAGATGNKFFLCYERLSDVRYGENRVPEGFIVLKRP